MAVPEAGESDPCETVPIAGCPSRLAQGGACKNFGGTESHQDSCQSEYLIIFALDRCFSLHPPTTSSVLHATVVMAE